VNELILALKDGFLYPAKIIDMRRLEDGSSGVLIHYQGWNKKYDEWVEEKETCRKMNEENTREQKRLLEEDKEKRRKANEKTTIQIQIQTTKSGGKSNNTAAAVGNNKNKNKNDDEVLKRKKNATTTKREKSQSTGKDGKKSITKESNSNTI
jgi:mortality factor 4-like protein 1